MMKRIIISVYIICVCAFISQAQVRIVNTANNDAVINSPAFIDASSNMTINNSTNVGKGLIFPRVDLSAMTSFPAITTGIPNSFPTRFDGMIVYNTATSGVAGVGSTQGTLTAGFWYYDNKSTSNTGGTWKPVSVAPTNLNTTGGLQTADNGLTQSGINNSNVSLGGTLTHSTGIEQGGYGLYTTGSGKVSIGAQTSPNGAKFEVNGASTNTSAFNAGSGTMIDFSKSNLAYTTANPGNSFTLLNLKDGGTYTLAVQGTVSGTATFDAYNTAAAGVTVRIVNNMATLAGKQTLYTFIVMGSTVYVFVNTGF